MNLHNVINYDSIPSDLNTDTLNSILSIEDVNQATLVLVNELKRVIYKNTDIKRVPCRKIILEPWVTPGLLRCIKHRDKLHLNIKQNPDNEVLLKTYKRYRNFCGDILKKVRAEYDRSEVKKAGNDSKKTWQVVKGIAKLKTRLNNSAEDNVLLKLKDGPSNSLNYINTYFANVGKNLAEEIPSCTIRQEQTSELANCSSFGLMDTDCYEVRTIIMNLKPSNAVGHDGIPTKVVKLVMNQIIPALVHIANRSFASGVFPSLFKTALIKPIYKGGDRGSINNYRPISILSALSKILERLINRRLISYLNKFNIISKNQFGFVAGKSTELAVNDLTDFIVRQLDKKNKCISIFLDLAKAFDTVSVPILIDKMERVGIRGVALKLFTNYLTNRTQRVKVGDVVSDSASATFGVPQGSVLGPTLFLIYVNDLCNIKLQSGKLIAFADDTALVFSAPTWNQTVELAEIGLEEVMSWLRKNLLTLNVNKTKYVTFSKSTADQPHHGNIRIRAHICGNKFGDFCSCSSLERCSYLKYLGVMVDGLLNWQEHIKVLTGRIRKLIMVFKRLRHIIDLKLLTTIYYALCHSLLAYCVTVWGGTYKTYLLRTERAQRAVLKVMLNKPFRFPTNDLYSETGFLTVRQLFIQKTMLNTHRNIKFDSDSFRDKRRKDSIVLPEKFTTSIAQRHQCFLGTYLYRQICQRINIYSLPTVKCKHAVTTFLLSLSYEETENLLIIQK